MAYYKEWSAATPVSQGIQLKAALAYSIFSNEDYIIPLRILDYAGLTKDQTFTPKQTIPRGLASGAAYGGNDISWGAAALPRIQISGEIDTPTAQIPSPFGVQFATPTVYFQSRPVNYVDIIGLCLEGNILDASGENVVVHPTWFRDSFGRFYPNVRIEKFTAKFVEGVPGRATFQATLRVFGNG